MLLLPTSNSPRFRFTLLSDLLGRRELRTDPEGWDALGVHISRDPITHGMATEYTVTLGFVKDGRAYLRRAYDAAGIEANVVLIVEQLDPNSFAWLPYYRGRVNLSAAKFSTLKCQANVENEDFTQKFLNRATVAVDLWGNTSVGGSVGPSAAPISITLHSRAVVQTFSGNVPTDTPTQPGSMLGSDPLNDELSQLFYFGYPQVKANELGLGLATGGFISSDPFDAVPIFVSDNIGEYIVEFGGSVRIRVRLNPNVPIQDTGRFEKVDVRFQYRLNADPDSPLYELSDQNHNVLIGFGYDHTFVIPPQRFIHQLQPGDRIYLYAEVFTHEITTSGDLYNFQLDATEYAGTYLRIRANTKTDPTPAFGLLAYEAFDRVAQALTDEPDAFRSEFFGRTDTRHPQPIDGAGSGQLVTGGFQLRGFPLPSAPAPAADAIDSRKSLYASWRELFDAESAIHWLGYGIELAESGKPVVRVEPAPYFYPAEVVLDLTVGTPTRPAPAVEVETSVEEDRHFQSLEFGYAAWQPERVNGLDEANTKRQWTTPLTQVATAYSQVSKYATSGQLLELTRRQRFADSETTDSSNDTTNFLVSLLRRPDGGFETERNQRFTRLDGVLDPGSIYNARYTPARMLRNHGPALRAGLEPAGTRRLRLAFGEGNNAMVSQLLSETAPVAEAADILVTELAAPLWRPEADALKDVPVTRDQLQALLANPRGRVRYYDAQHVVREGWILDFKHHGTDQTGDFTLLPCAD